MGTALDHLRRTIRRGLGRDSPVVHLEQPHENASGPSLGQRRPASGFQPQRGKRDANGETRSTSVTSGNTLVATTIDEQNRVTAISESVGGPTFAGAFTYDVNSNLTNEALRSGSFTVPITLTYDNSSRLTGLA